MGRRHDARCKVCGHGIWTWTWDQVGCFRLAFLDTRFRVGNFLASRCCGLFVWIPFLAQLVHLWSCYAWRFGSKWSFMLYGCHILSSSFAMLNVISETCINTCRFGGANAVSCPVRVTAACGWRRCTPVLANNYGNFRARYRPIHEGRNRRHIHPNRPTPYALRPTSFLPRSSSHQTSTLLCDITDTT
jgi:hypothetical protein